MPVGKAILIVDGDSTIHALLNSMLKPEGYDVTSAQNGEEALSMLLSSEYDLVLTDVRLPGMDGLTLLARIQELRPETKVVVITAETTPDTVIAAIRDHAYSYLSKPLSRVSVLETLQGAFNGPVEADDIQVLSARPHWISLRVRCKLATADRLAQFFRELATGLSNDDRDSISAAFRELLMNAIEHGGKSDPKKKVNLTYIRTTRSIIYYIRDPGEGFSLDQVPHAAISNSDGQPFEHAAVRSKLGIRPGGFGILLTKKFADELVYSEKGNEVLLIKYLS